jgi:cobalamin synthase
LATVEEQVVDRDSVTSGAWNVAKRIALLVLLAVLVVGLHSAWEYLGAILAVYFLALTGIYLVRCGYPLLQGLIALLSRPFNKPTDSPTAIWLLAGVMLNALEIAACLGLAIYVLRAMGWYTDIELPVPHTYQPILN